MRYITDIDGYVKQVSFGADISCGDDTCSLYEGSVPAGYASLETWFNSEVEKLYRWKIVDGQLVLDSAAAAPCEMSPIRIRKLWENPDTTVSYAGQEIAGVCDPEVDTYLFTIAVFNLATTNARKVVSFSLQGWYGEIQRTTNIESSSLAAFYMSRRWALSASGGLIFTDANTRQGSTVSVNNIYLIPVAVYGVKMLDEPIE